MKKAIDLILLLFALLLTCCEPTSGKVIPHTLLVLGAWAVFVIVSTANKSTYKK